MMTTKRRAAYGSGAKPYQRGDGIWVARIEGGWTTQGTRRRIVISAKTEAECKRRLKERQRELAAGKSTGLNVRETVRSWALTWLPRHARKVRPTTYTTDAGTVNKWIIPTLGHRRLSDLNPGDLRRLEDAIRGAGRTSTTALHAHKILLTMLKAAIVEGHNVRDGVFKAPKPGKAANDRTEMPLDDALKVLDVIRTRDDGPRWVSAMLNMLRQGESLGLTWACVDLETNRLDISWQLQALPYAEKRNPGAGFQVPDGFEAKHLTGQFHLTRPKTQHGQRSIPLVPVVAATLRGVRSIWDPNPWDLVWTSPAGQPIRDEDDRDRWYEIQKAAGVKHPSGRPYYLHEARHTGISLLLRHKVDRGVIQALAGHSKLVDAYVHIDDTQTREAQTVLAGLFRLGEIEA